MIDTITFFLLFQSGGVGTHHRRGITTDGTPPPATDPKFLFIVHGSTSQRGVSTTSSVCQGEGGDPGYLALDEMHEIEVEVSEEKENVAQGAMSARSVAVERRYSQRFTTSQTSLHSHHRSVDGDLLFIQRGFGEGSLVLFFYIP